MRAETEMRLPRPRTPAISGAPSRKPAFLSPPSNAPPLISRAMGNRLQYRQEVRDLAPVRKAVNVLPLRDELAVPGLDPGSRPEPRVCYALEGLGPVVDEAEGSELSQNP